MDVADDIAYGVHDLEDALALRLIDQDCFLSIVTIELADPSLTTLRSNSLKESNDHYQAMVDGLFGDAGRREHWISRLVGFFVTAAMFDQHSELQEPLLRWRVALPKEQADLLKALKAIVWKEVIQSPRV